MIRSILAALFSFVLGSSALAQSCSVPNTLTNGTNADATQVMANFNAILTCFNNQAAQAAPRGYLAGLTLSTAGSSASFGVAAGLATSDDATTPMKLSTSITKTTGGWAVGSGNGALDAGSIATTPTWYHVFLIERTDTSVVDVLISLNPTSPTLPTNYTKQRRIGSMKTNGSAQWIKFWQQGDRFIWDVPITDVSAFALSNTSTPLPLSVPPGLSVEVTFIAYWYTATAGQAYMTFQSGLLPTQGVNTPLGNISLMTPGALSITGQFTFQTDTAQNIRAIAAAAYTTPLLYVVTQSWLDTRGRIL